MNNAQFYRGLLSELEKLAGQPIPAPAQPKKKPFYKSPVFWSGVAGLGLGGALIHKAYQGTAQPAKPNLTPAASPANPVQAANVNDTAKDLLGQNKMLGAGLTAYGLGKAINSPITKRLGFATSFGAGLPNISDAINNPDNNSASVRGLQGGGGALDVGLNIAGKKNIAAGLLKLPGISGMGDMAAKRLALSAGADLIGGPAAWAITGGQIGQTGLGMASDTAQNVASDTGLQDFIVNRTREMNSQDPAIANRAAQLSNSLFNSNQGRSILGDMRQPDPLTILGARGTLDNTATEQALKRLKTQYMLTAVKNNLKLAPPEQEPAPIDYTATW